jgi:hypothetical protein
MRIHRQTPKSPEATRELAALDAALAGEPVDPDLAELGELALDLQAERPVPRERFVAELDALVQGGFRPVGAGSRAGDGQSRSEADRAARPGVARPRPWRFSRPTRRALPLALGTAASLLIGVTAVVSSGVLSPDGDDDRGALERGAPPAATEDQMSSPDRGQGASPGGARTRESAPSSASPGGVGVPPGPVPPPAISPGARERSVEHQAALTLSAARDRVEDVADHVIRITDRYRGFVLSSTVSGGSEGRDAAALDLRIPSGRLQAAISDMSRLARVRSRTQSTLDVTAGHVSARSRLREATAERRSLLRQLAAADTPNETASIRARLRLANRRIARARAALRDLATRVRYAAVSVTVEPARDKPGRSDGWTAGEGLDDALGILGTSVAIALVSGAVLAPIALLLALVWVAVRRILRQRRERTLGPTVRD